jgi:PIN domain nuclease of toxin-antitoxin system
LEGRNALKPLALDTHAWVWWASQPDRLSRTQRTAIERQCKGGGELLVSIISCWEVALLSQHGRFRFTIPLEQWLEQATTLPHVTMIELSVPIITQASRHTVLRDPADMLIVATAQRHDARLVTSDGRIEESALVPVVG